MAGSDPTAYEDIDMHREMAQKHEGGVPVPLNAAEKEYPQKQELSNAKPSTSEFGAKSRESKSRDITEDKLTKVLQDLEMESGSSWETYSTTEDEDWRDEKDKDKLQSKCGTGCRGNNFSNGGRWTEIPSEIKKLYLSGKYRDMLNYICESEELFESGLRKNIRLGLHIKYCKGLALEALGEYSEALEVFKDTYEKQRKNFGEEDEDYLDTARSLGIAYFRLKHYEEAKRISEYAIEKRERNRGKEHQRPERILELKNDIANVLSSQNKLEEGLKIYKEILEPYKRLLGVKHPGALTIMYNISYVKYLQREYQEALKDFQQVLEILQFDYQYFSG